MKINLPSDVIGKMISIWSCAFGLAVSGTAHAQTYDAVNDFSLAGNPNGVWSYGTLSSFTGGTITLFNRSMSNLDYTGELRWDNNGSIPNAAADDVNRSGSQQTSGSVVFPTNQLDLDGENFIADVRWTAPATAIYNLTGLFQRNDTSSNPVSVRIVENGSATLFTADNFNGNGNQLPFNLTSLSLPAGTTLDFAEGAGQFNNDTTGLVATITAAPEPSSIGLIVLGAAWLTFRRRSAMA